MKKIAMMALVSVVSLGMAFAEGDVPALTFHGEFLTGARVELDAETGNTAQLFAEDYNVPGVGAAFKLNGAFDAGTYGASVQIKFADGYASYTDMMPTALVGYSYGWMKFFGKSLTVKAGVVDESAFDSVGDQGIYFFDKGGVVATWSPIEGLLFGGAVGLEPALLTSGSAADIASLADAVAFGVSYRNDAVTIQAAYTGGDWCDKYESYAKSAAYAQFGVTAVENLQFEADALFIDLADFSARGEFHASELVGYSFGKVTPSLLSYQYVSMDDTASAELTFEPKVRYALSDSFAPYVGGVFTVVGSDVGSAGKVGFDASLSPSALVSAYCQLSTTEADHAFQVNFTWYF